MTETQQRFLREIAERVSPDRVLELYLFPSIRQGGMESGVAVFAAEEEREFLPEADGEDVPAGDEPEAAGISVESDAEDVQAGVEAEEMDIEARQADVEGVPTGVENEEIEETSELALASDGGDEPTDPDAPAPITRFVVYSASYRLTLKGHERGTWDAEVTAEADAPLHTIDDVVRGVQKRTGERGDAHRLTGDAFRSALIEPAWAVHD